MAFKNNNLSVIAYSNGFTLWHYHSNDDIDVTREYFNKGFELLKQGDLIIVNVFHNDGKIKSNKIFFVQQSNTKAVILKPAFE